MTNRRRPYTLRLLGEIRTQIAGRSAQVRRLVTKFSFDAWDALRLERMLLVPEYFRQSWEGTGPAAPNAFPQSYWAGIAHGLITRSWAMQMWKRVANRYTSVSFEDTVSSLSAFFDWSAIEICLALHRASYICEKRLDERGVKLDEEHPDFNLHQV